MPHIVCQARHLSALTFSDTFIFLLAHHSTCRLCVTRRFSGRIAVLYLGKYSHLFSCWEVGKKINTSLISAPGLCGLKEHNRAG